MSFPKIICSRQVDHHHAQVYEADAFSQPLPLKAINDLQLLGKLNPADAVLSGYTVGGDDLAGFDGRFCQCLRSMACSITRRVTSLHVSSASRAASSSAWAWARVSTTASSRSPPSLLAPQQSPMLEAAGAWRSHCHLRGLGPRPQPVSPSREWDGCIGRPKGKARQSCCIRFRCWPPPV